MYGPDFAPFSSDQILTFRRTYIRDYWDGATGLSRFNQQNKKNFFEDDDLLAMESVLRDDWAEELDAQWVDKQRLRFTSGDATDLASSAASRAQLDSRFRLLEAVCLEKMMLDPGMQASFIVGKVDLSRNVFTGWAQRIVANREWTQSRAGEFAMIPVQRM
jgi:hypothetical protein